MRKIRIVSDFISFPLEPTMSFLLAEILAINFVSFISMHVEGCK